MRKEKPKSIAFFGGSFDPPHRGHFEIPCYLYETLGVDRVVFLFSENWQKNPEGRAPIKDRIAMGQMIKDKYYPDFPFEMSDLQDRLGTHITYQVLQVLRTEYPEDRLIWVMGADNLASLHTWENHHDIMREFPVAVLRRPSSTYAALSSETAIDYQFLQASSPYTFQLMERGWMMLDNPLVNMSSSGFKAAVRNGQRAFEDPVLQDVSDYVAKHGLYGTITQPTLTVPET